MKIYCKIGGNEAVVVGYTQSTRGKVRAIVIMGGQLVAVRLKDVQLRMDMLPKELQSSNITGIGDAKPAKRGGKNDPA